MPLSERYLDPFTDFGFKKIFGTESNKDLLIDLLNVLLKGRKKIASLTYFNNERLGKNSASRRAVLDLNCGSANGEKFIIEMQRVKQQFFKDRSLYYSALLVQDQAIAGDQWNYRLPEIYSIGIMDFVFDERGPEQFMHEVKLVELTSSRIFYEKLTFIFLEMPKFSKTENELETYFDKWLYLLKNLSRLDEIPVRLQEPLFQKAFKIAEVGNLNKEEMTAYEQSLKERRDWKNAMDTAIEEATEKGIEKGMQKGIEKGIQKGIEKGIEKMAREMKKKGLPIETIVEITGLQESVIRSL